MYCTNCGKQASGAGKFCTRCGSALKQDIQQSSPKETAHSEPPGYPASNAAPQAPQGYVSPPPTPGAGVASVTGNTASAAGTTAISTKVIAIIVALVIAIGGGVFALTRGGEDEAPPTTWGSVTENVERDSGARHSPMDNASDNTSNTTPENVDSPSASNVFPATHVTDVDGSHDPPDDTPSTVPQIQAASIAILFSNRTVTDITLHLGVSHTLGIRVEPVGVEDTVIWTSSDLSVFEVIASNPEGTSATVTPVGIGHATLTASVGGVEATLVIRVRVDESSSATPPTENSVEDAASAGETARLQNQTPSTTTRDAPASSPDAGNIPDYITIRGVQYSTSLTELNLWNMNLNDADIEPLRYMVHLRELDLTSNQISDISPLAGLSNLEGLILQRNQISDISPLAGLTNLVWLFLDYNQVSNISPLAGLTSLVVLLLGNNQIRDLSPLARLTNLGTLHLHNNQISDISPLSGLTGLRHLDLHDNQISDISPLGAMPHLNTPSLSGNTITDWSPVAHISFVVGRP